MQGKLVLGVLEISSSYSRNIEEPTGDGRMPDTVQWWISDAGTWRIRTFGLDRDVHVYSVSGEPSGHYDLAISNTQKHYGEVLGRLLAIDVADANDAGHLNGLFAEAGLAEHFEVNAPHFLFWKPESERYSTKSTPS